MRSLHYVREDLRGLKFSVFASDIGAWQSHDRALNHEITSLRS